MKKVLSYPLSVLFYICFGIVLVVFHVIQWICLNAFGYNAHKKSVSLLNWMTMKCTHILGTTYTFDNKYDIPENTPLIIVSNHQSTYDIPPIIWYMRKYHPKFISKIELGRGIPSVSYNLRHGGSVLIDRKNPEQALPAIRNFARYIETNKRSAVIFPEGTRSRTGRPKKFQVNGLKLLITGIPSAYIVPITINNSWKLFRYGTFPLGLGSKVHFKVHKPMKTSEYNRNELIKMVEEIITADIHYNDQH